MTAVFLFLVVLVLVAVISVLVRSLKVTKQTLPISAAEAHRHAQLMARQLDLGLNDPMLRQSAEWEDHTRALLENYYGDSPPKRKSLP